MTDAKLRTKIYDLYWLAKQKYIKDELVKAVGKQKYESIVKRADTKYRQEDFVKEAREKLGMKSSKIAKTKSNKGIIEDKFHSR